ncbi:alpha-(1,3)-fucosyltransferase 9-like [Thalassophryne amazonica]|uniref:alpha-(1,3)-fucosyltransferase 9-like n=1 Tax=Thalassophryne amazonica TaxID=390379 RepID=UPI001470C9D8|nr:alpha-(1,3)-fucosyltransferase 9-like [Thalassophryne amazonica]
MHLCTSVKKQEGEEGESRLEMSLRLKMKRVHLPISFFVGCFVTLAGVYFLQHTGWCSVPKETNGESKTAVSKIVGNTPSTAHLKHITVMLIWLWPFGLTTDLNVCYKVNIEGCLLTADRTVYSTADAVVFHHVDIRSDLSNLPTNPRPPHQKWIWMNWEAPSYSRRIPGLNNLFNMTINYLQDSDINTPYGYIVPNKGEENFVLPKKDKLVCWIVSNWNENLARVKYFNELKKHIDIFTFGRAFGKGLPKNAQLPVMASCKFYLAFENSIHKDYITEKFYNSLTMGTVPVVLGPPRKNYESIVQGDAFIHVDDFKSPLEMAEHLKLMDKNEKMYLKYFAWHGHYKMKQPHFWPEYVCLACDHMRRNTEYKALTNIESWFWNS